MSSIKAELLNSQQNRNRMEYLKTQEHEGQRRAEAGSKSMRVRQTEKFIPPTHPVYVVTSSFEAPHISSLQEELDKHFIAMGMQTGRKKLIKMAGMPTDKFFIILDDSAIPIILQGEFLTLPSKVVRYPCANSAGEVVKAFEKYIGLGHYEISKEFQQANDHYLMQSQDYALEVQRGRLELPQQMRRSAEKTPMSIRSEVGGSHLGSSEIRLREISSIHKATSPLEGVFFVYDNRKDSSQFKSLVGKLKASYENNIKVRFISRIDQYISFIRVGKRQDNIVLVSEYSFLNLAKYFHKLRGFAVFQEGNSQINMFAAKTVLFFARQQRQIQAYLEKAIGAQNSNKSNPCKAPSIRNTNISEVMALQPSDNQGDCIPLESAQQQSLDTKSNDYGNKLQIKAKNNSPMLAKSPQESIEGNRLPPRIKENEKLQIRLVKVRDLSKEEISKLKRVTQPFGLISNNSKPESSAQRAAITSNEKQDKNGKSALNAAFLFTKPDEQKRDGSKIVRVSPLFEELKQSSKEVAEKISSNVPPRLPSIDRGMPIEQFEKSLSSISAKSKIKRLKSVKQTKNKFGQQGEQKSEKSLSKKVANPKKNLEKPPISSIIKGHLRMGSDEHYSRSNQKQKISHYRALSADKDHQQTPQIKICLSSPKPSEDSDGQEPAIPEAVAEQNQSNQQPEYIATRASRAPHNAASAELSAQKGELGTEARRQQKGAFYLDNEPMCLEPNHPVQNSFGNSSGNNKYRIEMPILSENEMKEQNGEAISCMPKLPASLKFAGKMSQKSLQQVKEGEQFFELALVPEHLIEKEQMINPSFKNKLSTKNKIKAAQQNFCLPSSPNHHKKQQPKIIRSPSIPPIFDSVIVDRQGQSEVEQYFSKVPRIDMAALSEQSRLKQLAEGASDICGSSDISSIPRKLVHKADDKKGDKRFTFGLEEEPKNKLWQKKSPQKVKNLKNQIAIMNSKKSLEDQGKQKPVLTGPPERLRDLSGRIAHRNLRKSKSKSEVQRIFDRFKVKAAVQSGRQASDSNLLRDEPTQMKASELRNNLNSQNSDPRVGKIYSQLRLKRLTDDQKKGGSRKPHSVDEHPAVSALRDERKSPEPASRYQRPTTVHTSIQDLIDMNRYEKVIENGITIYRSKVPVRVESYCPSKLVEADRANPYIQCPVQQPQKVSQTPLLSAITSYGPTQPITKQDPYLLCKNSQRLKEPLSRNKQNMMNESKPAAKILARLKRPEQKEVYSLNPVNSDSVGVQCSTDPFNSLTNVNNLTTISNLTKSPRQPETKASTKKAPPRRVANSPHPIQDLLASKLSQVEKEASIASPLVKNISLPRFLTEERYEDREDFLGPKEEVSQIQDGQDDRMVLYLIDKLYPGEVLSGLNGCKSAKDSVLSFRNEQQLVLQLSQTNHIFDIVYVVSLSPYDFSRILPKQKNCYLVELQEGVKTKIKGNVIKVASLKYLKDVTELLLKQSRKVHNGKAVQRERPAKLQSQLCQRNSCLSPHKISGGRCQYSMNCCPISICSLTHRHY